MSRISLLVSIISVLLFVIYFALPASAQPLPKSVDEKITILVVEGIVAQGNYSKQMQPCRKAEQLAAPYDRDPFLDAQISYCFMTVEKRVGTKQAACNYGLQRLQRLQAVKEGHPDYPHAIRQLGETRQELQSEIGCKL